MADDDDEPRAADFRTVQHAHQMLLWLAGSPWIEGAELQTVLHIIMTWEKRIKADGTPPP